MSYRTLQDSASSVTGGDVRKASRRAKGSNQSWNIKVKPDGYGAVTITLPTGAVESSDGRQLEATVTATVAVPVEISVSDARVDEGAGALLAFAVTVSRASTGTVRVDYATTDGSAEAGVDYTASSGTATFETGESSKTVEVSVHDEGEETLTLALANVSGG